MSSGDNKPYPTDALLPGTVIQGYVIEKVLGRGAFGITYLAIESQLERQVAIKEYLPESAAVRDESSTVRARSGPQGKIFEYGLNSFINEAKTLVKFNHQNIVRVLTFFTAHGTAYLVMAYEIGLDLKHYLKQNPDPTEQQLLDIFIPINKGLSQVHQSAYIHRDIKADNIYIREDQSPVLLDFGAARNVVTNEVNQLTRILTLGYAPYEQDNPAWADQGPWTDIYALGATLYYCVTGRRPVNSSVRAAAYMSKQPDPFEQAVDYEELGFSQKFLSAIDKALEFEPSKRPQSLDLWNEMLLPEVQHSNAESISSAELTDENKPNSSPTDRPANIRDSNHLEQPSEHLESVKQETKTALPITSVLATATIVTVGFVFYINWQPKETTAINTGSNITQSQQPAITKVLPTESTPPPLVIPESLSPDSLVPDNTASDKSALDKVIDDSISISRVAQDKISPDELTSNKIEPQHLSSAVKINVNNPEDSRLTSLSPSLLPLNPPTDRSLTEISSEDQATRDTANNIYISTMVIAKTASWHYARAEKIKDLIRKIKALPSTIDRTRFIVDQSKKLEQAENGFEKNLSQYKTLLRKLRQHSAENINKAADNFINQAEYSDDENYRVISERIKEKILVDNGDYENWRDLFADMSTSALFVQ